MGRHPHDRARAVVGQHVVGDPDRQGDARRGMACVRAREDARLLLGCRPFLSGPGRRVLDVLDDLARAETLHERMLRREHDERCPVQRVGAGREDDDVLVDLVAAEPQFRSARAADPVPLDRLRTLRPVDRLQVVDQRVGVLGDLEEPLLEPARLDLGPTALAAAVDHLLVRQHGLVVRAPVDGRLLAVRETLLEELEEEPLRPAVVLGLVGGRLARPVDRPAEAAHLAADVGDVLLGDLARMAAFADGGVLGRKPERVVAHWPHHGRPVSAPEVREDVAHRVVEHVAHVQVPGRVRQHLEHVELVALRLPGLRIGDLERVRVVPNALPLRLDCSRLVPLAHACLRVQKSLSLERPVGSSRGFLPRWLPALGKKLLHLRAC